MSRPLWAEDRAELMYFGDLLAEELELIAQGGDVNPALLRAMVAEWRDRSAEVMSHQYPEETL